jgi:hypothetical protein
MTETFGYIVTGLGRFARLLDRQNGGPGADWAAFFDNVKSKQVVLERIRHRAWRWDVPSLPVINTIYFDGLPGRSLDERDIEWAAGYRDVSKGKSNIVFYEYRDSAWRSDTLAVLPGLIRSIRFLQHTQTTKSVAAVTDSVFWTRVLTATGWDDFQIQLLAPANDLGGATLPDGSPIWIYGENLFQVRENRLSMERVPFDSTVALASNLGLFADASGAIHVLYRVRDRDWRPSARYVYRKDEQWREETVLDPAPTWYFGALTVVADTVYAAILNPRKPEVLLAQRRPDGNWEVRSVDRAGDLGLEVSVAERLPDLFEHAVAFFDRTNGDLKVAFGFTEGGHDVPWQVQQVDTAGVVGRFPRVAATESQTDVFYFDESRGLLKHARQSPSGYYFSRWVPWEIETVDTVGAMTLPPGFIHSSDGSFDLAYQNPASATIRYGRLSASGWQIEEVTQAELEAPGEVSLFRVQDSLFVGFVDRGRLRLAVRRAPGEWEVQQVPTSFEPVYAAWAADPQGNLHVVYRVRRGFQDEIRHSMRTGDTWSDNAILTTMSVGTWLRLKWGGGSWPALILVFPDDGRARAYSYESRGWNLVGSGQRFMGDTAIDFTLIDIFTLTLFYRALSLPPSSYEPDPYPELVADVVISIIDNVDEAAEAKRQVALSAYPNPFNERTTIEYTVPTQGRVQLELYDLLGRRLKTLRDEVQAAGQYRVSLSGAGYASGVYFCRYSIAGENGVQKLVLMK